MCQIFIYLPSFDESIGADPKGISEVIDHLIEGFELRGIKDFAGLQRIRRFSIFIADLCISGSRFKDLSINKINHFHQFKEFGRKRIKI